MSSTDWLVLVATLVFIVIYGIYKSRGNKNIEGYLLGNHAMPWYTIGFSIIATQASAITFLSAPGQAFTDGMRFLQFYFGLPIAMIVLCVTVVPIFHRLQVYTAYEYLENRFDLKTRSFGALLFLVQRGVSTGITIYAPSIILSSILGWNIYWTNVVIGGLVVIYTATGGTKAVSYTHLGQVAVIWGGMVLATFLLFQMIPDEFSFGDVVTIAGKTGKMNLVDFEFDLNNRYNIWSGVIGGFFLAMSYFGTDQSQVGRYITGKSITEIRLGLLFNGLVKIPMQLFILFIGALLYVFYIFNPQPIFFNKVESAKVQSSEYSAQYNSLEKSYADLQGNRRETTLQLVEGTQTDNQEMINMASAKMLEIEKESQSIREEAKLVMKKNDALADVNDTNYIFLKFVIDYLPEGIIGLLIAVIFSASMSSTSSALNALASTSVVDIYKRSINKNADEHHYLMASKWATGIWAIFAVGVAAFASKLGSLIEAVNILGSLFYGTILGIFLVGFYMKKIGGNAVFYSAIAAEVIVVWCFNYTDISFLWYNVIGCLIVMGLAWILEFFMKKKEIGY